MATDDEPEIDDDAAIIKCWCGAEGTFEELFDDEVYGQSCGGSGVLHCECGGDQCVCHHHGEVECEGCEDCGECDDDCDGFFYGYEDDDT